MGMISHRRRMQAENLENRYLLAADLVPVAGGAETVDGGTDVDGASVLEGDLMGDFNSDGFVDVADIDALASAIRKGSNDSRFDVDGDGHVIKADLDMMIHDVMVTEYGDANLDQVINMDDMMMWQAHSFRYDTGWAGGDFNGDGLTDVSDFNLWNANRDFAALGSSSSTVRTSELETEPAASEPGGVFRNTEGNDGTSAADSILEGSLPGDLDDNSVVDAADINMLASAIRNANTDPLYDLNTDGAVSDKDMTYLVEQILETKYGDADLDGTIDQTDYAAWQDHRFQMDTGWETGDFNGDGVTDVSDFNLWNANRVVNDGNETAPIDTLSLESGQNPDDLIDLSGAAAGALFGDLNQDGQLDAADVDYIHAAIRDGGYDEALDLDADGSVDKDDCVVLLADAFQTVYGDANLDGQVGAADLGVWQDYNFTSGTGWATGDFNGDGVTDVSDFNVWNSHRTR